jgi:hypothetical protein
MYFQLFYFMFLLKITKYYLKIILIKNTENSLHRVTVHTL